MEEYVVFGMQSYFRILICWKSFDSKPNVLKFFQSQKVTHRFFYSKIDRFVFFISKFDKAKDI